MNIFQQGQPCRVLKKSRTRTLVTIVGVILSAAMVTAVATFGVSLLNYLVNGAISEIRRLACRFLDVPPSFAEGTDN